MITLTRIFLLLGSLNALLAVALGAFGAHALRARLSAEMLTVYQTGVQYHMYHALALLLVAVLSERLASSALVRWSGRFLTAGIVLFPGSLYLLAISGLRGFGAITPFGGVCFLAGWALLVIAAVKNRTSV